jgi:hypothetical protein
MRLLFSMAFILVVSNPLSATSFTKTYGGPEVDRGVSVALTADGGYVLVGLTSSFSDSGEDVYLVRTDTQGAVVWEKTFGGDDQDAGWAVHETGDGDFLVAGFTKSYGAGGFDCLLLRTNASGELQWRKTFGGEEDDRCWALQPTAEGGFVLLGETRSVGAGEEDVYLIKVTVAGEEEWSKTFGGEKGDRGFSVAQTSDGGFLIIGQTYSEGAGDRDAYVVKTDSRGALEWSQTYGGEASDVGHSVAPAGQEGAYLVTGYTSSFDVLADDPYLIKLDTNKNLLWTRVLPQDGVNHTITGARAADGGFCLVGFSHLPAAGEGGALLMKVNGDGESEWVRHLFYGKSARSLAYTVVATPDGGCVVTGHTSAQGAGKMDAFLHKVNAQGE